jgi:hypothetical protein
MPCTLAGSLEGHEHFRRDGGFVSAVDLPQCPCVAVIRAKDLTVFKFQKM